MVLYAQSFRDLNLGRDGPSRRKLHAYTTVIIRQQKGCVDVCKSTWHQESWVHRDGLWTQQQPARKRGSFFRQHSLQLSSWLPEGHPQSLQDLLAERWSPLSDGHTRRHSSPKDTSLLEAFHTMLAQQKSASSSKCLHSFGSLRTHSSGVKVFHPSPKALFAKISSFQGFNSPQNPHCISPEETPTCSAPPGQPALLPAPCAGLPWLQTAHAAQCARVCPVKAPNPHKAQAPKLPRANQTFVNKSRSAKSTHRWKAFTNRRISLKSLIKYCNSLHTSSSQWPRHFNWKGVWLRFFFPFNAHPHFRKTSQI